MAYNVERLGDDSYRVNKDGGSWANKTGSQLCSYLNNESKMQVQNITWGGDPHDR